MLMKPELIKTVIEFGCTLFPTINLQAISPMKNEEEKPFIKDYRYIIQEAQNECPSPDETKREKVKRGRRNVQKHEIFLNGSLILNLKHYAL